MTKGRDIAAESIGDLLEVARLQRRNGMLRVECSFRGYLEEGEIYLQTGEPIYAHTGIQAGQEALHSMLSWRNIYFAFASEVPKPLANILTGVRAGNTQTPTYTPGPSFSTAMPRTQTPAPQGPRWSPVQESTATITPQRYPAMTNMAWLVPQKSGAERDALSIPLSRRQRLIYFLIDGQRTVGDLARTSGRNLTEVELILSELQEQGLVTI